jgi:hypothetical protein
MKFTEHARHKAREELKETDISIAFVNHVDRTQSIKNMFFLNRPRAKRISVAPTIAKSERRVEKETMYSREGAVKD